MQQITISVINKLGLHARAAAKFVTLASSFECEIKLRRETQEVNGKSIMGVMMLAAARGTELTLTAEGPDETYALVELEALFLNRFGEKE